jgi:uncharacterized SAM-binding protein YcdF (DUF218 family)
MLLRVLKQLFVPGSFTFLLCALTAGTLLLFRRKDNGRAGRRVLTAVLALYWIWSTPVLAVPLIKLLTPNYPPVQSAAQAGGGNAIVVLGSGMDVYRSRGDMFEISPREDALRVMEAARVYRILDKPWVIVTGGLGTTRRTEAARMAEELQALGVPADRIVKEGQARNTHEHGVYVPPLLRARHALRPRHLASTHRPRAARVPQGWVGAHPIKPGALRRRDRRRRLFSAVEERPAGQRGAALRRRRDGVLLVQGVDLIHRFLVLGAGFWVLGGASISARDFLLRKKMTAS